MNLNEIEKRIKAIIPEECEMTHIESLGFNLIIYLKKIDYFYNSEEQLIKKIAGEIKKRVLVRSDKSVLMPPEKAEPIIRALVPEDAGINKINFNPDFCEVNIEATKPGIVIGKGGNVLKKIIIATKWAPIALRTPTMQSTIIESIRNNQIKTAGEKRKFLQNLGKKICTPLKVKSDYVRMTALGGFKEVGRSCLFIKTPNSKVLIDCGINPDTSDPSNIYPMLNEMNTPLSELDAVIISHGHLDHMGFVPYLYKYGYDGPVYCTTPTRDLMLLLQSDYIDIMAKNGEIDPPYEKKWINKEQSRIIDLSYNEVVDITPEIKLTFYNAGHILGSSMVHLHIGDGLHNLVYTGDIKYGFTKLFNAANINFPRVETLFVESTYGGRQDIMPNRAETEKTLVKIIKETINKKGKVLIPVFAVGRSQELMLVLEEMKRKNPDLNFPVYIDGMVYEATSLHTAYPEYLKKNVQRRILSNDSPFEDEMFVAAKGSRDEIINGEPCVILAPSGMLSGGPSVEYLKRLADDERNTLIFVGYQSAQSLGRKIQGGMKEIPIVGERGRSKILKIKMRVETVEGFSGHSDRHQLLNFLTSLKPTPERVFTMHGDGHKTDELARAAVKSLHVNAMAPMIMDSLRLR